MCFCPYNRHVKTYRDKYYMMNAILMVMHQDEFQTTESLSVYLKQRRNQYGHKRSMLMSKVMLNYWNIQYWWLHALVG